MRTCTNSLTRLFSKKHIKSSVNRMQTEVDLFFSGFFFAKYFWKIFYFKISFNKLSTGISVILQEIV